MFDKIRFSQRFDFEDEFFRSTFQIKPDEQKASFTEYEYPILEN